MLTKEFDLSRAEWEHLIDQYVFNKRNRSLAKERLLDGESIDALAEQYNLSPERIKKIMKDVKITLLRHL